MSAFISAVLFGMAFLALAVWIELRERPASSHAGEHRGSAHRRT